MARLARVVVPGVPHHVTQRGNRRERIFFEDDDFRLYRGLIAAAAKRARARVWAYCFMPNHVHLIVTPVDRDGQRATFAEAHRRYTGAINARFRWTGHLFQGRFGAVTMAEDHLIAAARSVRRSGSPASNAGSDVRRHRPNAFHHQRRLPKRPTFKQFRSASFEPWERASAHAYLMRKLDYPMAPAVLAIVLGPLAEPALRQSLIGSHGDMMIFFERPISGTIMVVAIIFFVLPLIKTVIGLRKRAA